MTKIRFLLLNDQLLDFPLWQCHNKSWPSKQSCRLCWRFSNLFLARASAFIVFCNAVRCCKWSLTSFFSTIDLVKYNSEEEEEDDDVDDDDDNEEMEVTSDDNLKNKRKR